jgi:hypothetical protein
MPTRDRPHFVRAAIAQFRAQDWERRELVILDCGAEPLAPALIEGDARIRYVRVDSALALGERRNLACEHSAGELIAHWDDDDWMAPWRLRYQATALLRTGNHACGITSAHFIDETNRRAFRYDYPPNLRPWLLGGSLVYRRDVWSATRFLPLERGEDDAFVAHLAVDRLTALPDTRFYVARIHDGNTVPKNTAGRRFTPVIIEEVEQMMRTATTLPPSAMYDLDAG